MSGALGEEHAGEHEGATEQLEGGEQFGEEPPTEEGGKGSLGAHDEGRVAGWGDALGNDLAGVGQADGEDASIENDPPGSVKTFEGCRFEDEAEEQAEQAAGEELDKGEAIGIDAGGEFADGDDLQGPDEGTDEFEGVAIGEGEAAFGAEEPHASGGDENGNPDRAGGGLPPEDGQQRGDEDDVKPGDEASLASGGVGQTSLLERGTTEDEQAG